MLFDFYISSADEELAEHTIGPIINDQAIAETIQDVGFTDEMLDPQYRIRLKLYELQWKWNAAPLPHHAYAHEMYKRAHPLDDDDIPF